MPNFTLTWKSQRLDRGSKIRKIYFFKLRELSSTLPFDCFLWKIWSGLSYQYANYTEKQPSLIIDLNTTLQPILINVQIINDDWWGEMEKISWEKLCCVSPRRTPHPCPEVWNLIPVEDVGSSTMGEGNVISTWYTAGLTAWQTIKFRLAGEECEDQASLRSNIKTSARWN